MYLGRFFSIIDQSPHADANARCALYTLRSAFVRNGDLLGGRLRFEQLTFLGFAGDTYSRHLTLKKRRHVVAHE